MTIRVLSDVLVSRIAAGEVVERPASAVKELLENALDAGAREIRVDCIEGGKKLIRITDDGSGIRADEVETAFLHHATSKLRDIDDLASIKTLGFRGEALASIAAVAQVTCITRHADESSGTLIRIDNGETLAHERHGRPPGTTMTIERLFERIPARLKFLKSTQTERGQIDALLMRYALAYPEIRFTLTQDGKVTLQTTGNSAMRDVLIETHGAEIASQMVEIESAHTLPALAAERPGINVSGYVALPVLSHGNRGKIIVFVNGRPVQDAKLTYAVVQAYHTLLMTGRYPIAVVKVSVPPADVDVNVHPAKAEVRFRDADAVFSAVHRAIRHTLLANMAPPEPPSVFRRTETGEFVLPGDTSATGLMPPGGFERQRDPDDPNAVIETRRVEWPREQQPLGGENTWERVGVSRHGTDTPAIGWGQAEAARSAPADTAPSLGRALPALRILGQLAATYILAEGPEGLYLIDQHAAHERILFEKQLAQLDAGGVASQALLDPVTVDVPVDAVALLETHADALRQLGFEIDPFGGSSFLVRAVPQLMAQDDVPAALRDIVAQLESGDAPMRSEFEAKILRRVCKRMAIKAGRVLSFPEMQALVRDLEACESPRTCPHGRPTMIQIGMGQLEREFGRLGR
jgi:DNA mismatch repair protein MutL